MRLLSTRLGLMVGLLGASVVMATVFFTYLEISRQLDLIARSTLNEKLGMIEHTLQESYAAQADIVLRPHHLTDHITGHDYLSLGISAPTGESLLELGSEEALRMPAISRDRDGYGEHVAASGYATLNIARQIQLRSGQAVAVTLSLERKNDALLLNSYIRSATFSLPLILILVGGCGWWLARCGLASLQSFSTMAARISARDLEHRIDPSILPGEFKEAADAINFMLDRLVQDIQQLSQFSDDLAHELRSPLNNLIGKTQVTLSRERAPETYRQVLESCMEEFDRMSQLISQMLFLASTRHPDMSLPFTRVNLRQEIEKVVELFAASAEEKQVIIEIAGDAQVNGDPLMIQRAVSNLLSNALRHSSRQSTVSLTLRENSEQASVTIQNSGEGIAAKHLPRIFDRFYRVHSSRSRQNGGTGLGLAIVKTIMSLHGGTATVTSTAGQDTCFTLSFPRQVQASSLSRHATSAEGP